MNGTATPHRRKNRTTITIKKWGCKKTHIYPSQLQAEISQLDKLIFVALLARQ